MFYVAINIKGNCIGKAIEFAFKQATLQNHEKIFNRVFDETPFKKFDDIPKVISERECLEKIETIKKLYQDFKDNSNPRWVILAILTTIVFFTVAIKCFSIISIPFLVGTAVSIYYIIKAEKEFQFLLSAKQAIPSLVDELAQQHLINEVHKYKKLKEEIGYSESVKKAFVAHMMRLSILNGFSQQSVSRFFQHEKRMNENEAYRIKSDTALTYHFEALKKELKKSEGKKNNALEILISSVIPKPIQTENVW